MRLRIKAWLVAASAMVTVVGCEPPREMSPVAPPGFDFPRTETVKGEEAQAIGEQASASTVAKQNQAKAGSFNSPPTPIGKPTTTASGLTYETLIEGTGATAQSGQEATVHYTGTLADGSVFDSSRDKPEPLGFKLGTKSVVDGWEEGIPGMKVGERRKLTIPPALGYGANGKPPKIPANATLTFDIELLGVK
jgi:FKBP-type peptidyl-prolyl cis-trans isomerase FkpA